MKNLVIVESQAKAKKTLDHFREAFLRSTLAKGMMDDLEFKTTLVTTFRCLTRLEEGKARFMDHLRDLLTFKESKYHNL